MPEVTQVGLGGGKSWILIRSVGFPGKGPVERQPKQRMVGEFQSQASCPLSQGGCGWGGNSHQKTGARGKQGCQEMNPTQGPSSWPALCPWPAAGRLPFLGLPPREHRQLGWSPGKALHGEGTRRVLKPRRTLPGLSPLSLRRETGFSGSLVFASDRAQIGGPAQRRHLTNMCRTEAQQVWCQNCQAGAKETWS